MLQLVATLHGLLLLFPACQSAVAVFHLSTPLVLCMSPESSHANLPSPAPQLPMLKLAPSVTLPLSLSLSRSIYSSDVFRRQNLDLCRRIRRNKYNPDFSRRNPGRVRILPAEPEFYPFLLAESGFCRILPAESRILPLSAGRIWILPVSGGRIRQNPAESDKHWPKPIWQGKVWAPIAKDRGSDSETQAERQASDC